MSARLLARLERLRPHQTGGYVIYFDPNDEASLMDAKQRARAAGRPMVLAPKPCKSTEEWLLNCSGFKRGPA